MCDPIDKINTYKFCLRVSVLTGKSSEILTLLAGPPAGAPRRTRPAGALLGLAVGELGGQRGQTRPASTTCVTVRGARNLRLACKAHILATRKEITNE